MPPMWPVTPSARSARPPNARPCSGNCAARPVSVAETAVCPARANGARVNVTRTLRATLDRIAGAAPAAGAHLSASIHTGRACRYQPVPGGPSRWRL
jgi:hypothetical protein